MPHDSHTAGQLRAQARDLLRNHGHGSYMDDLTRENCGACALAGYGEFSEDNQPLQPNYGGWARIYVEAGKPISAKYAAAFISALDDDNRAYANALREDIKTFGVHILSA